jgi:hypothetical protein
MSRGIPGVGPSTSAPVPARVDQHCGADIPVGEIRGKLRHASVDLDHLDIVGSDPLERLGEGGMGAVTCFLRRLAASIPLDPDIPVDAQTIDVKRYAVESGHSVASARRSGDWSPGDSTAPESPGFPGGAAGDWKHSTS